VTQSPYRDPRLSIDRRADDLLSRMTTQEKLAQLGCVWITALLRDRSFDPDVAAAVLEDGIGQVTRIGATTGLDPASNAALMNAVQRVAVEQTRLGIPVIVHEESVAGYMARDATQFPQAIALASTWNPDLLHEVAVVIREQLRAVGARQGLAPVLDIARDPRWGRLEETYGEDPYLAGALGVAYVRGLQTADLRDGVVATGKHFLAHAMSEGGRNHGPVQIGPRELREVYAEPFAAAIREAGLASIMNSYGSVDGLPCAGSAAILTGLLRDELGFDGTVVADYFAVAQLHRYHRTAPTMQAAGIQALTAGLDIELPSSDCYGPPLADAVASGAVSMDVVDRAVRRVIEQKLRLGLFESPYVDERQATQLFDSPAQRGVARRAAAQSLVLLTNDGVLPLTPAALTRVAVIGPGADDRRLLQGDYHYPAHQEIFAESAAGPKPDDEVVGGDPPDSGAAGMLPRSEGDRGEDTAHAFTDHVTCLRGLRTALEPDVRVGYALGCEVTGADRSQQAEAVELAQGSDVAIVVLAGRSGLTASSTVGEGRDATDLGLTGVQEELARLVAATGTPTVVVVLSGRAHTLEPVVASASAVVQAWPLGEEGGNGLADFLLGAVEPSGRLPVSLPRTVGQLPVYASPRAGGRKVMTKFGGAYIDSPVGPLFPFGHGLSYTSFEYASFEIRAGATDEPVMVSVEVRNVGDRAGVEVVQLYASDRYASVARPGRQLIGFTRLELAAGQSERVKFRVDPSRLAFYDQAMRFVTEPGLFGFAVGSSSADIRQQGLVELTGQVAEFRQRDVIPTAVTTSRDASESAAVTAYAGRASDRQPTRLSVSR
jgi:beta-glucosidase